MRSNTANPSLIFCDTFLIVICSKLGHCSFLRNYLDARCSNNISYFFYFNLNKSCCKYLGDIKTHEIDVTTGK